MAKNTVHFDTVPVPHTTTIHPQPTTSLFGWYGLPLATATASVCGSEAAPYMVRLHHTGIGDIGFRLFCTALVPVVAEEFR